MRQTALPPVAPVTHFRSPQPLPIPFVPAKAALASVASPKGKRQEARIGEVPPPSKVKQPRARRQGRELHHGSVRRSAKAGTASKHWGRGDLAGSEVKRRQLAYLGCWALLTLAIRN